MLLNISYHLVQSYTEKKLKKKMSRSFYVAFPNASSSSEDEVPSAEAAKKFKVNIKSEQYLYNLIFLVVSTQSLLEKTFNCQYCPQEFPQQSLIPHLAEHISKIPNMEVELMCPGANCKKSNLLPKKFGPVASSSIDRAFMP